MFRWHYGPLFDSDPDSSGTGTGVLDPGIPHEHDSDDGDEPETKKAPTAEQARIAELEKQLDIERNERIRANEDARYFANRRQQQQADDTDTTEVEDDVVDPAAERRSKLTPEKMLELLTEKGPEALQELGFVTREDLVKEVRAAEKRGYERIGAERADGDFTGALGKEFPDIMADSDRVSRGEQPKTEIFKRSGELYREAVRMDPQLKGSKSLLLVVARQAKAELAAKGGGGNNRGRDAEDDDAPLPRSRQQERRERIEGQRPPASRSREGEESSDEMSTEALQVAKFLKVPVKDLAKHRDAPAGGRRRG